MKVENKIALVTGASEGIGRAIALKLAAKNMKVVAISRSIKEGALGVDNILEKSCDISDPSQVQDLLSWVKDTFGGLDVLVNNAGIWQKVGQLESISDDVIQDVIATDLTGTILMSKAALPLLRASSEAAIVNVISKSGVVAQEGQSVYTAAKYGVRGFTDVLRADLKDTNIHIMAVYQSGTDTDMFRKTGDNFSTDKFTDPADLAECIVNNLAGPDKFWAKELHIDRG